MYQGKFGSDNWIFQRGKGMTLDDDDQVQLTAAEEAEMQTDLKLTQLAAAGDRGAAALLRLSDFFDR